MRTVSEESRDETTEEMAGCNATASAACGRAFGRSAKHSVPEGCPKKEGREDHMYGVRPFPLQSMFGPVYGGT